MGNGQRKGSNMLLREPFWVVEGDNATVDHGTAWFFKKRKAVELLKKKKSEGCRIKLRRGEHWKAYWEKDKVKGD